MRFKREWGDYIQIYENSAHHQGGVNWRIILQVHKDDWMLPQYNKYRQ